MTMKTEKPIEFTMEKLHDSRFIHNLKSSHYVIMPVDLLFGYDTLTIQEKFFYACLVHYGNISVANGNVTENGQPIVYPAQRRLADEINLSQSTISRYTKSLAAVGLVEINDQGTGRHNWLTLFTPTEAEEKRSRQTPLEASGENSEGERDPDGLDKLKRPSKKNLKETRTPEEIVKTNMKRKAPYPKRRTKSVPDRRSAKTMADHFTTRYQEKFGGSSPLITGKEFKHFKDLIDHYGYDKVQEFVDFAVDYYDAFRRDKRLTDNLTVGMIYGFRGYLEEKVGQYAQKEAQPTPQPDEGVGDDSAW